MNSIISLNKAGVRYRLKRPLHGNRHFWALKDVSLKLSRGEKLGIIGSNGAGKSTLMKLLAGIISHDRGVVTREKGLLVSLLTLGVGFEGTLTGRENAILSGMLFGMHRHTIEKRMARVIEFSELGEFIDQPFYTYSSGMGAKLGFAVAMEINPDVLLLDEVMGVGDARFTEKSTSVLMRKINSGMAVVLISHDPASIRRICDHAIWIDHGVSLSEGSVEMVTKDYENSVLKITSSSSH